MQLPNAGQTVVAESKVRDYLLNPGHPVGGSKAAFFFHFGFRRDAWQVLADALRTHAVENPVAESVVDPDGETFRVEGELGTPSGRKPRVRTVWLLEIGEVAPRFITAYPLSA